MNKSTTSERLFLGGCTIGKRRGYYKDEEGDTFSFSEYPNRENDIKEGRTKIYYYCKKKQDKQYYMSLDHPLIKHIDSSEEKAKKAVIALIEKKKKVKKRKQMHNMYRPGGLGWFITREDFKHKRIKTDK